jgi:anhydro-N-acetylmuramic acid kinase
MHKSLFIGVMTGTSADGIDICLNSIDHRRIELLDSTSIGLPCRLKSEIKALCSPGINEIFRAHSLGVKLSLLTAQYINQLLAKNLIPAKDICAIGFHGQTIRHHPETKHAFSVQVGCASTLAHHTQIKTVTDFRMADIAAGGQGAPLVPGFHKTLFYSNTENRLIINIGGIANITFIPADSDKIIHGFDTGPGNTLLDEWIFAQKQKDFDNNGEWAKSGKQIPALLDLMMNDNYITKEAPKSTGKEYFNLLWLKHFLADFPNHNPEDIQRTLLDFSCHSIYSSTLKLIKDHDQHPTSIYLCGGGINNTLLVETLKSKLPNLKVASTLELGIHPQLVEASAFAWLASRTIAGLTGNLKEVTGATQDKILGGIYLP